MEFLLGFALAAALRVFGGYCVEALNPLVGQEGLGILLLVRHFAEDASYLAVLGLAFSIIGVDCRFNLFQGREAGVEGASDDMAQVVDGVDVEWI